MKAKKISAQIEALKKNLSKAEADLVATRAKADENEEARTRAAVEGRDLPPRDRRAVEDAEATLGTLTAALARAEAEHAAAVRDEEADGLRAELKALSKKVAASDAAIPEALGRVIEDLSRHLAIAGRMATIGDRLRSIGAAFDDPETWGVRTADLVERANNRTWEGRAKTHGERAEVAFELHPGDFLA